MAEQERNLRKEQSNKPRSQTTWHPSVNEANKNKNSNKQRTQSNGHPTSPYRTSVFYDFSHAVNDKNDDDNDTNEEIQSFLKQYEEKLTQWESKGQWVEVRETLSGKIAWYNSKTTRLVFDTPPNVEILNVTTANQQNYSNDDAEENVEEAYYLNRSLTPLQNENIVQSLLNMDKDVWNFDYNNRNVYNYRLNASKRDHSTLLPDPAQYVFPEYFSLSPLPDLLANKFLAKIKLPQEFCKSKKYSLVQIKNDITTASDVIKAGVSKLDAEYSKAENVRDFIIKIVGQEAYMYGEKHVIEYEAVRDALRNEDDVEFALIKRPDFQQKIDNAKEEQLRYTESFKSAYDNILSQCQPTKRSTLSGRDNENDNETDNGMQRELDVLDLPTSSISLYEFEWHYRLKIEGLTNVTSLPRFDPTTIKSVYVCAEIWCGDSLLKSATLKTDLCAPSASMRWGDWMSSGNLLYSQLPRESVLCIMVFGEKIEKKVEKGKYSFGKTKKKAMINSASSVCLSWCRLTMIDDNNQLRKGKILMNMWPILRSHRKDKTNAFRYRGCTVDRNLNVLDVEQCQVLIAFDEHPFDVIAPKYTQILKKSENRFSGYTHHRLQTMQPNMGSNNNNKASMEQNKKSKHSIDSIIKKSPLKSLSVIEQQLVWSYRENLWHRPEALSAFVASVNWTNVNDVAEAHKYLAIWAAPKDYSGAIEFLDYKVMDTKLREIAVNWLNEMDDSELQKYLLQLVQCLKFELQHENALALFLIGRALRSPYQIGHYFFWHLKSEYDQFLQYRERFGLYLEEYLLFSCGHSQQLFVQNAMLKRLEWISKKVTAIPEKKRFSAESKRFFKKELHKLNVDMQSAQSYMIPLYPRWRAINIKLDKCKYMSSKKVPLWLVFENADNLASDIVVMYKYGDDLRQDMLTLQIISLMDNLWLHKNLDLHLKPYRCLATGDQAGMLQIVLNSTTVNNISENYGGVFNERTIDNFIKTHNKSAKFLNKAKETFARSCAGYCIATYVLGISDRHSSNYMVCKNGQFFHIDFGHFLGNWKTKWGIKRERTPLVFTNQMKFAISNENESLYKEFISWCSDSYNILRERSRILLILFRLMIAAGMEELVDVSDIVYFEEMLNLDMDKKNATKHIEKAIGGALKDWGTYVNNKIHQMRHQGKK